MAKGFYPRLAMTGITKNRQMYLPYMLTCTGMVMMYYIVAFLSSCQGVAAMPGGDSMQLMLSLGCGVIGVFSLIFLFYTNSFLIRRRKKEFGLYNILGMGKGNLARILIWESLIVAAVSLAGGLVCGILFSKLAELVMANILGGTAGFALAVEPAVMLQTLTLFAVIFLLILLNSLRQIHLSKPVELLHSDRVGEKPPRANWILALLGALILACAYYLALSIEDPVSALIWFFVAVIMVIIATYLLFVAGSVALCRLLQKNKRYYYRTNHLISVSSMAYRMKRNGAGLASICILSTMVLVMLSSTACLYLGAEDSLRSRYPRNLVVDTAFLEESDTVPVRAAVDEVLTRHGEEAQNVLHYRYLDVAGYFLEDQVIFDQSKLTGFSLADYSDVRQMFIVPLEDYNRLMGTEETLEAHEVLLYSTKSDYSFHLHIFTIVLIAIHRGDIHILSDDTECFRVAARRFCNTTAHLACLLGHTVSAQRSRCNSHKVEDISVLTNQRTVRFLSFRLFGNETVKPIRNIVRKPCPAKVLMCLQPPYGKPAHVQLHIFCKRKEQAGQSVMLKSGAVFCFEFCSFKQNAGFCEQVINAVYPFVKASAAAL